MGQGGKRSVGGADRSGPVLGETARGLISLGLCLHFAIVGLGLATNLLGSPLEQRVLEVAGPYGVTFNWIPFALRFHWTQGAPLDDDHRLTVVVPGAAADGVESGPVVGHSPAEKTYLRRLARRLAEYQQGEDSDSAAVLAESIGARQMRRTGSSRVLVRSERLEPALRNGGGNRGAVAEVTYSATALLDNNGRVLVLTDAPVGQTAQAVKRP
ncbi:MAG: hypothetical protein U0795_25230 [Pirellulales bacterium]